MATVAVLGLGAMGRAFAARLLATGHEVVVWNRTPGRADPLVAAGATLATTPADAAGQVDFVILMVSDAAALAQVTAGPDGALVGANPGTVLLLMATVGPSAVTELAARLPAGVELIDCPVLGSISEAGSGTLAVFVGGAYVRAEPVLSSLGRIVPVGAVGAGSAAKLVANSTLFGVLGVLGEAVALGHGLGLSSEAIFQVLAASPLAAQAERRRPALEGESLPLRFSLSLAHKDASLVVEAAAANGQSMPLATAALGWLAEGLQAGQGGADYSAVLAHITGSPSTE